VRRKEGREGVEGDLCGAFMARVLLDEGTR
jgi:hypothetical protein